MSLEIKLFQNYFLEILNINNIYMFFPFIFGIGIGVYIDQHFNVPKLEPIINSCVEKLKDYEKKKK